MYCRNPITIMCATRLNDGIFRVLGFPLTPARLHKSDFVFRFYVYGGIFGNPPRYFFICTWNSFGGFIRSSFLDLLDYRCAFCLCFELCSLGWRTTV
jgi:hypothetical protein